MIDTIDFVCESCHFDGSSNTEIDVEYNLTFGMILIRFLLTDQNWENRFFLTNKFYFFFSFEGIRKNHNKFSTAILKFDDPTKWHT